jgi:hypothetical protein
MARLTLMKWNHTRSDVADSYSGSKTNQLAAKGLGIRQLSFT